MPTVYVYVGLPGVGKSTHAKEWAATHSNTTYLSSDTIREEFYGDESIQGNPNAIFSEMFARAHDEKSLSLLSTFLKPNNGSQIIDFF